MDVRSKQLMQGLHHILHICFSSLKNIIALFILLSFSLVLSAQQSNTSTGQMPIYAAFISDSLAQQCAAQTCEINSLNAEELNIIASQLEDAEVLAQALSTSQYEVLIGNATINQDGTTDTLVMEITTTWRAVPIDDIVLSLPLKTSKIETAAAILSNWFAHVKTKDVFEAPTIYQVLQASNYHADLNVPQHIGEFELYHSALYRDPLQGSISRYTHPNFEDAIVDISVYPASPFSALLEGLDNKQQLNAEINKQVTDIKSLIANSGIEDFVISDVSPVQMKVKNGVETGYQVEVMLNTQTVPVYSTQYVFIKHDKIIKLSGNVPQRMMQGLVAESLPQISVPGESVFMKSMRKG